MNIETRNRLIGERELEKANEAAALMRSNNGEYKVFPVREAIRLNPPVQPTRATYWLPNWYPVAFNATGKKIWSEACANNGF